MRRLSLCVALAVVSARPVAAETILYATAASQQRVDAFRVLGDGSLTPDPVKQQVTGGIRPRRLVARGCNLYVAENDRVEVFRIHRNGRLDLAGATRQDDRSRPHDIDFSADGKTLYVPVRRQGAIAAFPLDDQGLPNDSPITENGVTAGGPTSCVYGPPGADWEDIEVVNDRLYAVYTNRILVYHIDASGRLFGGARVPRDVNKDGTIAADETACPDYTTTPASTILTCIAPDVKPAPDRPDETCPFSSRGHLPGAVGLAIDGTTLVISERFIHRLQGFPLEATTGNFPPRTTNPDVTTDPTGKEKKAERRSRKKNRTVADIRYIGLTLYQPPADDPIIYAAGFQGRTDAFRLANGILPRHASSRTAKDVTSTPTRTAVGLTAQGKPVLYVAGGERDRIQVFHLFPQGAIDPDAAPMMETNELKNSFPNDVVLADITNCD